MVVLQAAFAIAIAWGAAIFLLYPALKPHGEINTRTKRGIQVAAYAGSLVAGVTASHAISRFDDVNRWLAVALLTPLAYGAGFVLGYALGPSSSQADHEERSRSAEDLPSAVVAHKEQLASVEKKHESGMSVAAHGIARAQHPSGDVPQEQFWSTALSEFESSDRRTGVWARVFAEAQGSESVAKALYLRERASQLAREDQNRFKEQERQAKQSSREAEPEHMSAEQRSYELVPKGRCPNPDCCSVMPLSNETCPKCGAIFGGKGWKLEALAGKQNPTDQEAPAPSYKLVWAAAVLISVLTGGVIIVQTESDRCVLTTKQYQALVRAFPGGEWYEMQIGCQLKD